MESYNKVVLLAFYQEFTRRVVSIQSKIREEKEGKREREGEREGGVREEKDTRRKETYFAFQKSRWDANRCVCVCTCERACRRLVTIFTEDN